MLGIDTQTKSRKINVKQEGLPDGTQILTFIPEDVSDLDAAIIQAKNTGIELIKNAQTKKFSAGIEAVLEDGQALAIKVFLAPKLALSEPMQVERPGFSHLFSSYTPHIEEEILKILPQDKLFFIETQVDDGVSNCITKFFSEFKGWAGILLEDKNFSALEKNRPESNVVKLNARLSTKKSGLTYEQLIKNSNLDRVDLLVLKETGKELLAILRDIKNIKPPKGAGASMNTTREISRIKNCKPKVVLINYIDEGVTLHDIKEVLHEMNYKLQTVYYQFALFIKN